MRRLVLTLCAAMLSACGMGTYGDTGSPEPGPSWPWVCPDGGVPEGDAGCLPAQPTDAEARTPCADGACD